MAAAVSSGFPRRSSDHLRSGEPAARITTRAASCRAGTGGASIVREVTKGGALGCTGSMDSRRDRRFRRSLAAGYGWTPRTRARRGARRCSPSIARDNATRLRAAGPICSGRRTDRSALSPAPRVTENDRAEFAWETVVHADDLFSLCHCLTEQLVSWVRHKPCRRSTHPAFRGR